MGGQPPQDTKQGFGVPGLDRPGTPSFTNMKQAFVYVRDLLDAAGWTLVRERRHAIWRCPCGEHQMTVAMTPGDHRSDMNAIQTVLRMQCPSTVALEQMEAYPWEEWLVPVCRFCQANLSLKAYKKEWVYHAGVFACLSHHGIPQWHKAQCRRKKTNKE